MEGAFDQRKEWGFWLPVVTLPLPVLQLRSGHLSSLILEFPVRNEPLDYRLHGDKDLV